MTTKSYKRLILTACVTGYSRQEAKEHAHDFFRMHGDKELTSNTFGIETKELSAESFLISFYDVYFVKHLSFKDYVRHLFRKLCTAIIPNFGIKIFFVIIEPNGTQPQFALMDWALHTKQ
ncbi:hypothetical protein [Parabacteroides chinchillae]|uniref:hypothetical protein n=1 Tax=Parabacteroides chinchillae TaxID=871327 RepID=UPI000CDEC44C|nr:hypothetical protein [Parabacteroides chinchillae]